MNTEIVRSAGFKAYKKQQHQGIYAIKKLEHTQAYPTIWYIFGYFDFL